MTPEQIDQLIQKYGQPAFDLAMRQVQIDIAFGIVVMVIAAIIGVVCAVLAVGQWRLHKAATNLYDSHDMSAALCGVATGLAALTVLMFGATTLSAILNPAWAALQKLLP